jgi:hypothetical protein
MALSALHVTAIFSATWSPSGDLGPRSTPIRSIFAALLALSPSASAPVSAAGRCFGWHCWGTWACLGQRMFCFAGRLGNTICGWFSLLICVSSSKLYKSRMLIHVLKVLRPKICCVLVKADLSDWKFSFQNNCKYLVRLFVVSINLRSQIFVRATPAPVQITKGLQISGLLGRIAIFNWEHVWSFCYFNL